MKINSCLECIFLRESDDKDFKIGYPKECKHICSKTWKWIENTDIIDEICPIFGYTELTKYTHPYTYMGEGSKQIYYQFTKENLAKFIEYIKFT